MVSDNLEWMEIMAEVYFTRICVAVRKLCALKGVPEMADDIIGHAFQTAVERSRSYNPELTEFDTWVIGHAKWYLAELFQAKDHPLAGGESASGIHLTGLHLYAEIPSQFADEPTEDRGAVPSPSVPFVDPFDVPELPLWVDTFIDRLSDLERKVTELLLLKCGEKYPVAEMARDLGVTRGAAQQALTSVREKARQCIEQYTTASR